MSEAAGLEGLSQPVNLSAITVPVSYPARSTLKDDEQDVYNVCGVVLLGWWVLCVGGCLDSRVCLRS